MKLIQESFVIKPSINIKMISLIRQPYFVLNGSIFFVIVFCYNKTTHHQDQLLSVWRVFLLAKHNCTTFAFGYHTMYIDMKSQTVSP